MKRKSFLRLGLALGGCHFLSSLLVVPFTLRMGEFMTAGQVKGILMGVLHYLTKLLYFPILGLALYPRHWFPGPWISIPILVNSLLWGALLAGACMVTRRFRASR